MRVTVELNEMELKVQNEGNEGFESFDVKDGHRSTALPQVFTLIHSHNYHFGAALFTKDIKLYLYINNNQEIPAISAQLWEET